jgi:hypothetical protein
VVTIIKKKIKIVNKGEEKYKQSYIVNETEK